MALIILETEDTTGDIAVAMEDGAILLLEESPLPIESGGATWAATEVYFPGFCQLDEDPADTSRLQVYAQ